MLTNEQIADIKELAVKNDGHCDRCNQIIRFYKYPVSKSMVVLLKAIQTQVQDSGTTTFNFDDINVPYHIRSQVTKARFHGFIAKAKDVNGTHIQNTWIFTKKAGAFLSGEPVYSKVVVYDNQLLGHDGELVTLKDIKGTEEFEQANISTEEASVYSKAREGVKSLKVRALYQGQSYATTGYQKGQEYDLVIDKLTVFKPVKILEPISVDYSDIAEFQKDWHITKKKG